MPVLSSTSALAVTHSRKLNFVTFSKREREDLVRQVSAFGADILTTPMYWKKHGNELEWIVRQMSWKPPWCAAPARDSELCVKRVYRDPNLLNTLATIANQALVVNARNPRDDATISDAETETTEMEPGSNDLATLTAFGTAVLGREEMAPHDSDVAFLD